MEESCPDSHRHQGSDFQRKLARFVIPSYQLLRFLECSSGHLTLLSTFLASPLALSNGLNTF